MSTSRRDHIMNVLSDLVASFLYHDRREDEDLPLGDIEEAIDAGEITEQEIVDTFAQKLRERLRR